MPRIPQNFIDQVIVRTDIMALISKHVQLKRIGQNYTGLCPFHQEKTPSFHVSVQKQLYHCFGCQAGGNALNVVMQYSGKSLPDAVRELAQQAGMQLPDTTAHKQSRVISDPQKVWYDLTHQVQQFYTQCLWQPQGEAARRYLLNRGIETHTMQKFALGYAPAGWDALLQHFTAKDYARLADLGLLVRKQAAKENAQQSASPQRTYYDRFRHRIIFPILDQQQRVTGFGGRALTSEQKPKYLNSPESVIFNKREILYGLHDMHQHNHHLVSVEYVLVVEGYMDQISLVQHGIKHVVACLGTAITEQHLHSLFDQTNQIIFAFDGDQAGEQAAMRTLHLCLPLLQDQQIIRFLFLPEGEDPDTMIRKRGLKVFNQLLQHAPTLMQIFFEQLKMQADVQSYEGRVRLATQAMPEIQKVPGDIMRKSFLQQLSSLTQIPSLAWGKLTASSYSHRQNDPTTNTQVKHTQAKVLGRIKGKNQPTDQLSRQQSARNKFKLSQKQLAEEEVPARSMVLPSIIRLSCYHSELLAAIRPALFTALNLVQTREHRFLLELFSLLQQGHTDFPYLIAYWHDQPFATMLMSALIAEDRQQPDHQLVLQPGLLTHEERVDALNMNLSRLVTPNIKKMLATITKSQVGMDAEQKQLFHRLSQLLIEITADVPQSDGASDGVMNSR